MLPPDPITSAIVKGGLEAGAAAAEGLIQKIFGPAADEFGQMLKDKARFYRLKNWLRVSAKTEELLCAANVEATQVPLRTLLPIIDGATMEEDESLSCKWAGLLASAAASPQSSSVHPSFPKILSEMTPREAVMLDRLREVNGECNWPEFRQSLSQSFGCSEDSLREGHWNLFRLGLWYNSKGPLGSTVQLSKFGQAFLAATLGPEPATPHAQDSTTQFK